MLDPAAPGDIVDVIDARAHRWDTARAGHDVDAACQAVAAAASRGLASADMLRSPSSLCLAFEYVKKKHVDTLGGMACCGHQLSSMALHCDDDDDDDE